MIKRIFQDKVYTSLALILIFHTVGLIGFSNAMLVPFFEQLVPYHLLLMLLIVLWNNESWNIQFLKFGLGVFTLSFLIEMLGTNTGLIFGEYSYGQTLGLKLLKTPILIGVNWFLLVYGVGLSLKYFRIKSSVLSAVLGANILTLLDVFIEPIAIKHNYWQWDNYTIPIQNYIAWWICAFTFVLIFNKLHFNKQNIPGTFLLFVQFLFFILLNLL